MSSSSFPGDGRTVHAPDPTRVTVPPPRRDSDSHAADSALPPLTELPGLRVAVRYQAAGQTAGAGGDWYLVTPVPDGRVLISVGDVAGHGPGAVAAMLRLCHGLGGLAMTAKPPGRLLDWLGALVRSVGPEHTASALAGYFDPGRRTFAWAQAGHPQPALIRGGAPARLPRPDGALLGAPSRGYQTATAALLPGDLMLFYTDGLVERRDSELEAGAARALSAALGHRDPEAAASAVIAAAGENPADDTCLLVVAIT